MENQFLNKDKFSTEVESLVREKSIGYMEAIIHICEQSDIEVDTIKKYVNKNIIGKLEVEAQDLNFLPRVATIPGL